ncbi:hypothetical protein A5784_30745 [Mycobacterium sp. 852013-50091_SCH5140682]|uniref:hypothetical protein n=1 Tax=Mycobacterium sp. 852013-50091_SCH5140682 TaxID=1834109 RepID=UPI0007E92E86|nr:hypothetical protein [Mycobacterium sp. 852013-50091_SCH5140682]OBC14082.1 hypothetical protein A5784_30745 [Mycobacterium sp. 852013-50091_SCH5140682]
MTPEELAAVLYVHQGPFFDGVHSRCGCRRIVRTARDWAEHVAEVQREAERRATVPQEADHETVRLLHAAATWIAGAVREDPSGEPWTLTRTLLNELISRVDALGGWPPEADR